MYCIFRDKCILRSVLAGQQFCEACKQYLCRAVVGRAAASDSRDLQFESHHWQKFICLLYITEKMKITQTRPGPFKTVSLLIIIAINKDVPSSVLRTHHQWVPLSLNSIHFQPRHFPREALTDFFTILCQITISGDEFETCRANYLFRVPISFFK